jgi:hypothetical protein
MESFIAKLPIELISIIFSYTDSSSLLTLIENNDIKRVINENTVELLGSFNNITNEDMIVWDLVNIIKQSDTYMEWCKILYYADIKNDYYKKLYNSYNISWSSMFTSKKYSKYTIKLKMGLFFINMINNYDQLIKIQEYSKLTFDDIEFIFSTMQNQPDEFNTKLLYYSCVAKNNDKYKLNYDRMTLAKRMILLFHYNNKEYYYNSVICQWPEINFNYYINLIMQNIIYHVVFKLTTPANKTTEKTVEKFMTLRQELNISNDVLYEYFRNKKDINTIKYFQSNGLTLKIRELMKMYKITKYKEIIDNILSNNKLYNLPIELWNSNNILLLVSKLVAEDKLTVGEIFNKFTIDQIKQIRIKELMEDDDLTKTLNHFRQINIQNVASFNNFSSFINNNNAIVQIKIEHIKRAYYELTDEQRDIYFLKYIKELDIENNYQYLTDEQNEAFFNL